jgi:hypothetical protein
MALPFFCQIGERIGGEASFLKYLSILFGCKRSIPPEAACGVLGHLLFFSLCDTSRQTAATSPLLFCFLRALDKPGRRPGCP